MIKLGEVLKPYNPNLHKKDLGYRRWNVAISYLFNGHQYWFRTTVSARDRQEARRLGLQILHGDYDNAHGGSIQTKSVQAEIPSEKAVETVKTVGTVKKKKK